MLIVIDLKLWLFLNYVRLAKEFLHIDYCNLLEPIVKLKGKFFSYNFSFSCFSKSLSASIRSSCFSRLSIFVELGKLAGETGVIEVIEFVAFLIAVADASEFLEN